MTFRCQSLPTPLGQQGMKPHVLIFLVCLLPTSLGAFPPCEECEDVYIEYPADVNAPNPLQAIFDTTDFVVKATFISYTQTDPRDNSTHLQFVIGPEKDRYKTTPPGVCGCS
jgi:hypothetical protein